MPRDLVEARLVLQQAVQLVAAVGQSLAPAAPDDSQQSLELSADLKDWLGVPAGEGSVRAGLAPSSLTLFLAGPDGTPKAKFPLAGRSLQEGLKILEAGLDAKLELPAHPADFPHHPIADGACFPDGGETSRGYLAKLFANTQRALGTKARLWPHHFDLAATVKAVNAGFSPGDGTEGMPYWYVTFSQPPKSPPAIAGGGRWRTSGWAGAELPLEGEPDEAQVKAFFQSAFDAVMNEPAFRLTQARKRYPSNEGIGPIDLALAEGSTTVLLGTSGAGKSTLLKLLNGLIEPDSGEVLFRGERLTRESRLRMGYVVQGGGLFPHLTAARNVSLVARWLGWSAEKTQARLEELAALVRLPLESLQRYPAQLSGGQAQRVGLMRALMLDAPVLLLDEPLGALDPLTRFDLQQDLRQVFQRLGKTVAIVTHDISEAAFFGGTVLLFRAGHVEQQGRIEELIKRPATPFVERFVQAQRGVS